MASGAISVSNFYGKSNVSYYFLGVTNFNASAAPSTFDTSGNIYSVGVRRDVNEITALKISTSNTLSYSTAFPITSNGVDVIAFSGSSIYYATRGSSGNGVGIGRLTASTGAPSWPQNGLRYFAVSGWDNITPQQISVNSSGQVYVCGSAVDFVGKSTFAYTFIIKIATDGTALYLGQEVSSGNRKKVLAANEAPDGFLYAYGTNVELGVYYATVTKITATSISTNLASNAVTPTSGSANFYLSSGVFDTVNSAHYVWGVTGTGNNGLVAKFNSSLVLQWIKSLGPVGSDYPTWSNGVMDSSGNLYVGAYASASAGTIGNFILAKYNSSGALQWARKVSLSGNSVFYSGKLMGLSTYGGVLLVSAGGGYDSDSTAYIVNIQYPTDGSKSSGTSTLTVAGGKTMTLTFSTFSGTDSTPSSGVYTPGGALSTSSTSASTSSTGSSTGTGTLYVTTI